MILSSGDGGWKNMHALGCRPISTAGWIDGTHGWSSPCRPPTCVSPHEVLDDVQVVAVARGHVEDEGQLGGHDVGKVAPILQCALQAYSRCFVVSSVACWARSCACCRKRGHAILCAPTNEDKTRCNRRQTPRLTHRTCRTVKRSANCSRMSTLGWGTAS